MPQVRERVVYSKLHLLAFWPCVDALALSLISVRACESGNLRCEYRCIRCE